MLRKLVMIFLSKIRPLGFRGFQLNMKITVIMIVCTALSACASGKPKETTRSVAAVDPQRFLYKFEIDRDAGERYLPEDNVDSEQREYQKLIDLFSTHFKDKYGDTTLREQHQDQGEKGYALRGVHAKGHGCLDGTFTVEDHGQKICSTGFSKNPKPMTSLSGTLMAMALRRGMAIIRSVSEWPLRYSM